MTNSKHDAANAIGLDIGTSRVVLAQQTESGFRYRSELNAFVTLPFSKMTQSVLKKENIPHSSTAEELLVCGDDSEKLADLFHIETRRPMVCGTLNPSETNSLDLIRQIVESLTGDQDRQGRKLCFSAPAPALEAEGGVTYHEAALRQTLQSLGYDVRSINEGLAVIYAELEDSNYTGIGISCGGGMCNVCLAYLSVPVLSFSVPKAGDYIDAGAATVTGEVATRVRVLKEQSFHFNGSYGDKIQQALSVYYDEMIQSLVKTMSEAFSGNRHLPNLGRRIPVVLSGGSVTPAGFRERFEAAFRKSPFPIPVSEVRIAPEPLHSTAKGALVAALADL